MADHLLARVLLVSLTLCPTSAFRTDLKTGVISFNNLFLAPIPIGSPVEPEDKHFRLRLQKYYSLLWSCTVLLTVFDKSLDRAVDYAKLPCGVQGAVRDEGGLLRLGDLVYSRGEGELVFMMVGGGCVVRNYVRNDKGGMELRTATKREHLCRAMVQAAGE